MDREREVRSTRQRLMRLHSPRLQMALIVALTGAAGFLASVSLLEIGLAALAQRYALSVLIAYLVFLLLLRSWARLHDRSLDFPSSQGVGSDAQPASGACAGGHGVPAPDGPDPPLPGDIADSGEAVLMLMAIALFGGALLSGLWVVWMAPTLLAELLVDIALGARLYRRLRGIESADWLRTALRRTALPFLLVVVFCAGAGALAQHAMPEARTLGDLLRMHGE